MIHNEVRPTGDAGVVAALVQGLCAGAVMQANGYVLTRPVEIEQPTDNQGTAKPYFLVRMASGLVLRVDVSVVSM